MYSVVYYIVFDVIEDVEKFYIDGELRESTKISHNYWELAETDFETYEKNKA